MRTGEKVAEMPFLSRRDLDVHQLPGQFDAAGDALQLPEEFRRLHHQEAGVPVGTGRRLPVFFRLLSSKRKSYFILSFKNKMTQY